MAFFGDDWGKDSAKFHTIGDRAALIVVGVPSTISGWKLSTSRLTIGDSVAPQLLRRKRMKEATGRGRQRPSPPATKDRAGGFAGVFRARDRSFISRSYLGLLTCPMLVRARARDQPRLTPGQALIGLSGPRVGIVDGLEIERERPAGTPGDRPLLVIGILDSERSWATADCARSFRCTLSKGGPGELTCLDGGDRSEADSEQRRGAKTRAWVSS